MDSAKPPSLRSLLTRMVCTLLGLLLLYVLSIGPALYIAVKFPKSAWVFDKFYRPITWTIDANPPLQPLVVAYMEWWAKVVGYDPDFK